VSTATLEARPAVIEKPPAIIQVHRLPAIKRLRNESMKTAFRGGDVTGRMLDGTGVIRDTRMVLPQNPWKMRAWLSSAQTGLLDSGGPYTIAYNSVSGDPSTGAAGYDTANGFNTSTNQYTVKVSGFYQVNGFANLNPPSNGAAVQAWMGLHRVGDANFLAVGPVVWGPAGAPSIGAFVSDIVYVNAGNVLYMQVNPASNGTGNWSITGVAYYTFWAMQLISG
jgi:hypothetical protein